MEVLLPRYMHVIDSSQRSDFFKSIAGRNSPTPVIAKETLPLKPRSRKTAFYLRKKHPSGPNNPASRRQIILAGSVVSRQKFWQQSSTAGVSKNALSAQIEAIPTLRITLSMQWHEFCASGRAAYFNRFSFSFRHMPLFRRARY